MTVGARTALTAGATLTAGTTGTTVGLCSRGGLRATGRTTGTTLTAPATVTAGGSAGARRSTTDTAGAVRAITAGTAVAAVGAEPWVGRAAARVRASCADRAGISAGPALAAIEVGATGDAVSAAAAVTGDPGVAAHTPDALAPLLPAVAVPPKT